MNFPTRIGLALLCIAQLNSVGFAQSGIITTYVGPQLPVNGTQAITQAIDDPTSVASDGGGGFYVSSSSQNRVYRVEANGRLSLVAGSGTFGFSGLRTSPGGLRRTSGRINLHYAFPVEIYS